MKSDERQALINSWRKPSSEAEKERQDLAEKKVKDAIAGYPLFSSMSHRIFPKGSYPNNTNVRLDSDVDIVVECNEAFYHDYFGTQPNPLPITTPYAGIWTPPYLRSELEKALKNYFGSSEVIAGDVALTIKEKEGVRPSVDVVPAFLYYQYDTPDQSIKHQGNKTFRKSGTGIINWPEQQLRNGIQKNIDTGYRYKDFVRVLKRAENTLVKGKVIGELPSYLMECLIWNVPNSILQQRTLEEAFQTTLEWMWEKLAKSYDKEDWIEPNQLKYLFHEKAKWTIDDAKLLIKETWDLMGYQNA